MNKVIGIAADAEGCRKIVVLENGQIFVWYGFGDGWWKEYTPVPETEAWFAWKKAGEPNPGVYK